MFSKYRWHSDGILAPGHGILKYNRFWTRPDDTRSCQLPSRLSTSPFQARQSRCLRGMAYRRTSRSSKLTDPILMSNGQKEPPESWRSQRNGRGWIVMTRSCRFLFGSKTPSPSSWSPQRRPSVVVGDTPCWPCVLRSSFDIDQNLSLSSLKNYGARGTSLIAGANAMCARCDVEKYHSPASLNETWVIPVCPLEEAIAPVIGRCTNATHGEIGRGLTPTLPSGPWPARWNRFRLFEVRLHQCLSARMPDMKRADLFLGYRKDHVNT